MLPPSACPQLDKLVNHLLARWPEHTRYVTKSLEGRPAAVAAVSEELAGFILTLDSRADGGVDGLIDDYRFLCESIMLPEELYFRRHGRYRLSRFEDAERECYANGPYMDRYMNGLLVSQVFWSNHAHAFAAYLNDYLPRLPMQASNLEIGPGHGLFLLFAARQPNVARVEGWDVSPTSIAKTRAALDALGADRTVTLQLKNLFEAAAESQPCNFDSIVMNEILEHLEDPVLALRAAARHLKTGGMIWVNVPANSPSPDHIYLVHGPEHASSLVEAAGLEVVSSLAFPMAGVTLEKAIQRKQTISCVVIARKPAVS